MCEDFQPGVQAARGLRLFQGRDQIGEGAVIHAPAALRGCDGETDREMRFADAWRAEENDILSALDEAELMQTFDLLAPQRRLKGEIKVPELFDDGQATGTHRGLQPPIVAELRLRGEQLLDRLRGCQRAAVDALQNRIEGLEGARHPEIGEEMPQAIPS
jgi:hypothetical protein